MGRQADRPDRPADAGSEPDPADGSGEHKQAIGRLIQSLRRAAGLSLKDFAGRMGVGAAAVGHWEAGRNSLKLHDLPRLATALGVSPQTLAGMLAEKSGKK